MMPLNNLHIDEKYLYYYYCPYCGKIHFPSLKTCAYCGSKIIIKTKHDKKYYYNMSYKEYGDCEHFGEFIKKEIESNPLFGQDESVIMCPACGSKNIQKNNTIKNIFLSFLKKDSQDKYICNNCNNRW